MPDLKRPGLGTWDLEALRVGVSGGLGRGRVELRSFRA